MLEQMNTPFNPFLTFCSFFCVFGKAGEKTHHPPNSLHAKFCSFTFFKTGFIKYDTALFWKPERKKKEWRLKEKERERK